MLLHHLSFRWRHGPGCLRTAGPTFAPMIPRLGGKSQSAAPVPCGSGSVILYHPAGLVMVPIPSVSVSGNRLRLRWLFQRRLT